MATLEGIIWAIERASGFTTLVLLTLAVAVGLALSLRLQSPRWPRLVNSELHNYSSLLAAVFTGIHVLAAWVDPYTRFGWAEIFVPFASHYRPVWIACGIVALYLGIATGISTWLRPRIGYAAWRRFHVLTLAVYALAVMHGVASGSDTSSVWAVAIYGGSLSLVGGLCVLRLRRPSAGASASRVPSPAVPRARS